MPNSGDDEFRPKQGRQRNLGNSSGKRYVNRVLNAAGKINSGFGKSARHSLFTGRNVGRGNHLAASRNSTGQTRFRQRRVIIKARFVKLAGAGFRKAGAHLRYVQRDGVSKKGEPGKLYNASHDQVDGEKFLDTAKKDRHQFRFIVSPEDAHELTDMKIFTRDLMAQAEKDLGTKLDWVAVDHHNTDNPHTHIIVRGVDDESRDLVIARNYLSSGFRERASELMTAELGPRQDHEIHQAMRREVQQDRFTSIDRKLIQKIEQGTVDMRAGVSGSYAKFQRGLELARLEKLQAMGLAEQVTAGQWSLSQNMEPTLRSLGRRGDIIRLMHSEMTRQGKDPIRTDYEIYNPETQPHKKITGKLVSKGFSDEINDRYYLVIEAIDGKTHYADIGQPDDIEAYKVGGVVELTSRNSERRQTDRTIAEIAKTNRGLYSEELHARHDPKSSREFIRTHVRRLEALRRNNIARRFADGTWEVPDNYLNKVSDIGKMQAKRSPVLVTTRSQFSLDVQASATGATWLDRTLIDRAKMPMSNTGFGAEASAALKQRQAYLIAEGFAQETGKGISYQRGLLKTLEQREVMKVATTIASDTGKAFQQSQKGDRIEGVYSRPVELVSGRYAIIEKSKEFSLVPWRPVLERARGQAVAGGVSGSGISWEIGRKKGIGIS